MANNSEFVYNIPFVGSIADLIDNSVSEYAENAAFIEKDGDEKNEITYAQTGRDIRALAAYMCSRGLAGKRIAIVGKNCRRWALTYLAVCWGVGVIVPLDRELSAEEMGGLLDRGEVAAIAYTDDMSEKISAILENHNILPLPCADYDKYIEEGAELIGRGERGLRYINDPRALGILLFTSGTTGVAKGVMLSQYNIAANIMSVVRRVKIYQNDLVLSILPLHHTYECMAGFLSIFYSGGAIAYNSTLRRLPAEIKFYQPTVLVIVPLILETFHSKIMKQYKDARGGRAALALGRGVSSITGREKSAIAKRMFKPIHEFFGGRLRAFLLGAAALKPEVFRDFEKFGFTVLVGYGLTETSPVCIMHNDFYRNADDIGYPLLGVKTKIIDPNENGAGELCVKGPNVMLGYLNDPEATAAVIDEEGWFHTGDLVVTAENGAYKIVGRCKSMIVLAGGKKVFPEEIEHYVSQNPIVKDVLVFAVKNDGDVIVTASIYPDKDALDALLLKDGYTSETEGYEQRAQKLAERAVADACAKLPYFKRVRKVILRREEFVKTTTRKIKRFDPENLKCD